MYNSHIFAGWSPHSQQLVCSSATNILDCCIGYQFTFIPRPRSAHHGRGHFSPRLSSPGPWGGCSRQLQPFIWSPPSTLSSFILQALSRADHFILLQDVLNECKYFTLTWNTEIKHFSTASIMIISPVCFASQVNTKGLRILSTLVVITHTSKYWQLKPHTPCDKNSFEKR